MIPLHLYLSGFLSYRDPAELDFTSFDLACISGANGAGKSSLLDAITWAMFGQARRRDESMINNHCEAAEVIYTFAYEGNIYQVQRANRRGKTSELQLYILQEPHPSPQTWSAVSAGQNAELNWKPLSERTLRETQERLQEILRMDYETFVNASFFLQGKADLFTQQRPGDRKRILGSILGLEIWETYRQGAAERRRGVEAEIAALDGRLAEIDAELAEESARKARLGELQAELERLARLRMAQEGTLENIRKLAAALAEQRKHLETLKRQLQSTSQQLQGLEDKAAARQGEREAHAGTLARTREIEAAYQAWQQARADIEYWDEIASNFREHEKQRQAPLDEINAARARLLQEQQTLESQQEAVLSQSTEMAELQSQLGSLEKELAVVEGQLSRREALEADIQSAHQAQAEARAQNQRLKSEMDELKERIDQLSQVEGAVCPLCGQPLTPQDRQRLMDDLAAEGKEMGDCYRLNQSLLRESENRLAELETQMAAFAQFESQLREQGQSRARLSTHLAQIEGYQAAWEREGSPRLLEITAQLAGETFAPQARARLAKIDEQLKATGYDPAAHDAARRAEVAGRSAEADLRGLEKAQAALAPLEREIADLGVQIEALRKALTEQQADHDQAAAGLAAAEAQAPDLLSAERELIALQEQENQLRLEVGAARQKVLILDDLKTRRTSLQDQRQELASQVGYFKQLERAFGKDGVPALLIEQALPQIEAKTNEILDRLSAGGMSVRFETQAEYKDKRREDRRETLDIKISDQAGSRDYEMFSGGEAFRVNFAIRLALSEILAQRAGARLQTLVIDEGFGSQDALGRQRLVEAINLVRQDFAKILVITHIDELKDAFPTRIEVLKTNRGSTLQIV
ncbi:MAG TPA: SMC family ATPase [Anaerolineales bacterium]|nr:SMC family ATPase [Anaerolineales bacterium]